MDFDSQFSSFFINDPTIHSPYLPSESELLVLNQKLHIYEHLTERFPISNTKQISKQERTRLNLIKDTSLTYGEIDFKSFGEIFLSIQHRHGGLPVGGTFYDLGSGIGKALVAACLLGSFEECIGIEILESLHTLSEILISECNEKITSLLSSNEDVLKVYPKIRSINADILKFDWTNANFIFVNSTLFSEKMIREISNVPVQTGTLAISLTSPLSGPSWEQLEVVDKKMDWGEATVYIQKKINPQID